MIHLRRIRDSRTEDYRFMEALIVQAFPTEEYRELPELCHVTEKVENFHNNIILDGTERVGLLTFWDFGTFHYIEHFATLPSCRNRGYGQTAMSHLLALLRTPVVLEVEPPADEMARRRIGFYSRLGFRLWENEYKQPPYRSGQDWLPLCLMAHGNLSPEHDFSTVVARIHKEVYNV